MGTIGNNLMMLRRYRHIMLEMEVEVASDSLTFGFRYIGATYVNWGDGPNEVIWNEYLSTAAHTYESPGTYKVSLKFGLTAIRFDFNDNASKIKRVLKFDISGISDCEYMFYGCTSLVSLPAGFTIPSGVTSCGSMFKDCTSFTGTIPDLWNRVPAIPIYTDYATGCTNAANYADVPESWGGPAAAPPTTATGTLAINHTGGNQGSVTINGATYTIPGSTGTLTISDLPAGTYTPTWNNVNSAPTSVTIAAGQTTTISVVTPCLVKGTMITLADWTAKPVEDITYADELLVWDFDLGCFSAAKPVWLMKPMQAGEYYESEYSDGTILKTVGPVTRGAHEHYNVDTQRFDYINRTIGNTIATIDGSVRHISTRLVKADVEYYNLITARHFNCYANGVLTSCSLSKLYPVENMKYRKEPRNADMAQYNGIPQKYIDGLRLCEQPGNWLPYINNLITMEA